MELRDPRTGETDRMREVVESAMTTSYALSPQQIDLIVEDQFGDERLTERFDDADAVVLVAENGEDVGSDTVVGLAVGELDDGVGEVRWLVVDPEHRGHGIGTALFERVVEALRDRGAERVQAATLKENSEGAQFFERFDYVRTDERRIDFGEETLVEYVYTEPSAAGEPTDSAKTDADEIEFPDASVRDGVLTAATEDGRRVYIDREEDESGTEAPFFPAYLDEEFSEQFGYYCANCGSLDVSVDNMDRMNCGECGNAHASRSSESYDDSYL